MTVNKKIIHILLGPVLFIIISFLLQGILTLTGAMSIGTMVWMIYWWISRPFHIAVAGILPVVVNAIFNIAPMSSLTSQYASDSIILIFGSGLLTMTWASNGLDKRIALKALSLIGPSMKSQITVWVLASVILSTMLPNVMVCAVFVPIAIAMLSAAGYNDIKNCKAAVPILLSIGWGVAIGGVSSPLGGAMNLVAISYMEEFSGQEFMYIDWIKQMFPYFVLVSSVLLVYLLLLPSNIKVLEGTKEYFTKSYEELGPMKKDEKISGTLFLLAMIGSFARPLYASILPALSPAFLFLILGSMNFLIIGQNKKSLLTWEVAEKQTMWGMMISFAGGMALGRLINESGATSILADFIISMNLDGGLTTIIIIVVFARILSELTNSTASAAIVVPIVFSFAAEMGLNPAPYWFITAMAFNCELLFPISVRAIPVSYGLSPSELIRKGWPLAIIITILVVTFGYVAITFVPGFGQLPYLT